jgi:hypothetical protein
MNIKKFEVGMKVKTKNELVECYIIEKILKSVIWLRLDERIFKNIKPKSIIKIC